MEVRRCAGLEALLKPVETESSFIGALRAAMLQGRRWMRWTLRRSAAE